MPRTVAIIPARGGSKGIPRKNLRPFCGRPLISYSIVEALKASMVDEVYVSTEDDEISSVAKDFGAKVIERPEEFATDTASTFSVLRHAAETLAFPEVIVTLQPTSPLRKSRHIDEAIALLAEGIETVISVCATHLYMWEYSKGLGEPLFESRRRRQDMEKQYFENGSIYVSCKDIFIRNDSRRGMGISSIGAVKLYEMDRIYAIDLDTELDFRILEELYKAKQEDR